MRLHTHTLVAVLVRLVGRATPGPPSHPTCYVVQTTSLSISCAGPNLITARYCFFLLHNETVNGPMLPSQAQRT